MGPASVFSARASTRLGCESMAALAPLWDPASLAPSLTQLPQRWPWSKAGKALS